jgi:hypothetical protein
MDLLKRLCERYGLRMSQQFTAGHICQSVFKVNRGDEALILKIGVTPDEVKEIAKNDEGYRGLRALNLSYFIPRIEASEIRDDEAFMLMEYCGDDFSTQLQNSENPRLLYDRLVSNMDAIYRTSRGTGGESQRTLAMVQTKAEVQYHRYLKEIYDNDSKLSHSFSHIPGRIATRTGLRCFASWDFTPRNVFLMANGVKYADPNSEVLGNPIVDLACFAGVVRDVHALPESTHGYASLKNLATGTVAEILAIPAEQAERIFYLGRVLQCFLGARFRIQSDPTLAKHFFEKGKTYLLEKVLS